MAKTDSEHANCSHNIGKQYASIVSEIQKYHKEFADLSVCKMTDMVKLKAIE